MRFIYILFEKKKNENEKAKQKTKQKHSAFDYTIDLSERLREFSIQIKCKEVLRIENGRFCLCVWRERETIRPTSTALSTAYSINHPIVENTNQRNGIEAIRLQFLLFWVCLFVLFCFAIISFFHMLFYLFWFGQPPRYIFAKSILMRF